LSRNAFGMVSLFSMSEHECLRLLLFFSIIIVYLLLYSYCIHFIQYILNLSIFLIIFLWINLIINLLSHFVWLFIYVFRIFFIAETPPWVNLRLTGDFCTTKYMIFYFEYISNLNIQLIFPNGIKLSGLFFNSLKIYKKFLS
jgi:hypothetical protein